MSSASIAKLSTGANITPDVLLKICETMGLSHQRIFSRKSTTDRWGLLNAEPNIAEFNRETLFVQYLCKKCKWLATVVEIV